MQGLKKIIGLMGVSAFVSFSVVAQEQGRPPPKPSNTITFLPLVLPTYEGSNAYRILPGAALRIDREKYIIQTQGPGISFGIKRGNLSFGPVLAVQFKRKARETGDALFPILPIRKGALEAGGFVSYKIPSIFSARDSITVKSTITADITGNGHDGMLVDMSVGYGRPLLGNAYINFGLNATFADGKYMHYYFEVPDFTGPTYQVDGGLKDVGATFMGNFALSERWGLFMLAGYKRLVGDVRQSPIVRFGGTVNQFTGGLGLSHSF